MRFFSNRILALALSVISVVDAWSATPLSSPVLTNFNKGAFIIDYAATPTNLIKLNLSGPGNPGTPGDLWIFLTTNGMTGNWTNNAGILEEIVDPIKGPFYVSTTNLISHGEFVEGFLQLLGNFTATLNPGANVITAVGKTTLRLTGSSTNSATDQVNVDNGNGFGQLIIIINNSTNSFTMPKTQAQSADATKTNYLNSPWTPTRYGESLILYNNGLGWTEVARPPVGGGISSQGYWQNDGTLTSLVPGIGASVDVGASVGPWWNPDYSDGFVAVHDQSVGESSTTWLYIAAADDALGATNSSHFQVGVTSDAAPFAGLTLTRDAGGTNSIFEVLLKNDGTATITLDAQGQREFSVSDGSVFLTNRVIFSGLTNYIYLNHSIQGYGNGITFSARTNQTYSVLGLETDDGIGGWITGSRSGGSGLLQLSGEVTAQLSGGNSSVGISTGQFFPNVGGTVDLGNYFISFKNAFLSNSITIDGWHDSTSTNYSRVAISHTGTNGAAVFDSQSSGIAGPPRPIQIASGGTSFAGSIGNRFATQPASAPPFGFVYTNLINTNCIAGDVDMFTVPSGKRFLFNGARIIGYAAGNSFLQYKTNGVYYHLSNTTTAFTTNTVNSVTANGTTALILEEGEIASINIDANAICYMAGILFDNTSSLKMPRLNTLPNGITTLYTCPAGKYATACNISSIFPSLLMGPGIWYLNNSSGSRTVDSYLVPSGASADKTTLINTIVTASTLGNSATPTTAGVLRPGDALAIGVDVGANVGAGILLLEIEQ